jgi:hypothetical protein
MVTFCQLPSFRPALMVAEPLSAFALSDFASRSIQNEYQL